MTTTPLSPPTPLVSASWLAERLGHPDLLLVDASVFPTEDGYASGGERYRAEGHLPGAVFADLIREFSDPDGAYPFTRPSAERFTGAASRLGIGAETFVVVYDAALGQWATRLWWLLRAFGHDRAAVLDGGQTAWVADGRPLETGDVAPATRAFVPEPRERLWVDKAGVERILAGEDDGVLVCAVPPGEFSGATATKRRGGHIPGSLSVPAGRLVDADRRFLAPDELQAILEPAVGSRVVAYCAGGIAATSAAFALSLLGESDVAVYDGSLNEWSADPEAPLETVAG